MKKISEKIKEKKPRKPKPEVKKTLLSVFQQKHKK